MSLGRWSVPVVGRTAHGPGVVELEVEAPALAASIRPGQFVMLFPETPGAPYLGRPMSYFRRSEETLSVLFRVVGAGTRHLAALVRGDRLSALGPLGQPFPDPEPGEVCLVGGGVGVPPLYDWARTLREQGHGVTVLLGARSADQLLGEAAFSPIAAQLLVATDDGSRGHHGPVTSLLPASTATVYACGPSAMLKAVQEWARGRAAPAYLTLEARMACGFGACLGCTVAAANPDPAKGDYGRYVRVCTDGPTFAAGAVLL